MSSSKENRWNILLAFLKKYAWILFSVLTIVFTIILEKFPFFNIKEISNTSLVLGIISVFFLYMQLKVKLLDKVEEIGINLDIHEIHLQEHIDAVKLQLESLKYLLEPEVLKNLLPHSKIHFDDLLKISLSLNKAKMVSLISGKFYLSSDAFEDYYINRLLSNEDVTYYYSSAMITEEDYFMKNNIEELSERYDDIAREKEVVLLWFIKDNVDHSPFLKKQRELMSKKGLDILVLISDHNKLSRSKGGILNKDFGIAGDIACAQLIDSYIEVELEISNMSENEQEKVKLRDKFCVDFGDKIHNDMLQDFRDQIRFLQDQMELKFEIPKMLKSKYPSHFN